MFFFAGYVGSLIKLQIQLRPKGLYVWIKVSGGFDALWYLKYTAGKSKPQSCGLICLSQPVI